MIKEIFKRVLLCFVLAVGFTFVQAQETEEPDYAEIKRLIFNSKSPEYYPKLMRRYLDNDTTLSMEQYRHLYYGFTLQEDFVPYQREDKRLYDCRLNLVQTNGDKSKCPRTIEIAKKVLEDNPFDIPAISTMAIAYLQLGDTTTFRLLDNKQRSILDAILSSGDGDSPASAFHVINIEHEYEVINRLGLIIESDSLCDDKIEYLKVKENTEGETGFYFNFGACNKVYKTKYE